MKLLWMWIMLFALYTQSAAQLPANIDSLRAELQKAIPDTTRVNLLNALSNSLIKRRDFPGTLLYAKEALNLATQINYSTGIAYATMYLGVVDRENSNYTAALEKYAISLALFKELQDTLGMARNYHGEGNIFGRQELRRDLIQRYQSAIQLYEKMEKTHPAESNYYRLNETMKICDAASFIPDYKLANDYCQRGFELAVKFDNQREQATALGRMGANDYEQHNYAACVSNLKKPLAITDQLGPLNDFDKHQVAVRNFNLGITYSRYLGDLTQGLQYYSVAKKLQEELGNQKLVCETMTFMGIDLADHGYYAEALEQYLAALTLGQKINDKLSMFMAHKNIGDLFQRNKNFDEAENHYAQAQLLNKQLGLKMEASSILHNLGLIQTQKGNRESAIQLFSEMKVLGEEMKDTHTMVIAYTNLLILEVPLENQADLLPLFLSDLEKEEHKGSSTLTMDMYRFVGIFYITTKAYAQAETYFNKSLALATTLENKRGMSSAYRYLKAVREYEGDFEKALEYGDLYATLLTSVNDENNRRVITEIQTKYDTEKKEKEILSLQNDKLVRDLELQGRLEALHRIALEKEKIQVENRFNRSEVARLANEKRLQALEIEKNEIKLAMQKAASDAKQDELVLLNKEGEIHKLEIKKQKLFKNYMLGGITLFTFLSFLVYKNYLTRQKLKLQVLRNKIASDLHDDVGSTLSSISIFSDMAIRQSKEVMPLMETIGDSSRKMLDAMADIVWTIHPENDQFEKIILRMRNFAFDLLGAKDIDFEFIADEQVSKNKLPMEVRKNLYLIFKEATNNMVKYSDATRAYFSLKEEKANLTMLIRDNGKGFDLTTSTEGNGLKNMKKRAQEIGGKLIIESFPGNGTTVQLKIAV